MSKIGDIQKVKINEICRSFSPDSTVSEIADIMDLQDIGAVPVVDEKNQLIGVVSERDIVRKLVTYDEKSLVRYLKTNGKNIYSLGFLHKSKKFVLPLDFVEEGVKKCFEDLQKQPEKTKKVEEKKPLVFKPKKQKKKNNTLFSKLRNIDGKDKKEGS